MFYRYEARRIDSECPADFEGIFQHLNPYERRDWYCLCEPKWYRNNPDVKSQAWFTQHGYDKWHEKMEETIKQNIHYIGGRLEVRLVKRETLDNVVFRGKTQCIVKLNT